MNNKDLYQKLLEAFIPDPDIYELNDIETTDTQIRIYLTSKKTEEICPVCGIKSHKFKKRYTREIKYDSYNQKEVVLIIETHHFKCLNSKCEKKTFTEELSFAQKWQRRSDSLNQKITVNLVQSGIRGTTYDLKHLGFKISLSSVYRLFSRINFKDESQNKIKILGIDDCAKQKGQSYMTVASDLSGKTTTPVGIFDGRTVESISSFLTEHPEIEFVARDRSNAYSKAVNTYLKETKQIADRFHLLQNCNEVVEKYLNRKLPRVFQFQEGQLIKGALHNKISRKNKKRLNRSLESTETIKSKQNDTYYTQNQMLKLEENITTLKVKEVIRLVCSKHQLSQEKQKLLENLMEYYPEIKEARKFWEDFYSTIMGNEPAQLDKLFKNYENSSFSRFIKNLKRDEEAVKNAIVYKNISSGKAEGLNNKIKLIKRRGYGNFSLSSLETMLKLAYDYYYGDFAINLSPTAKKSYEVRKTKSKKKKEKFQMTSWF